MAQFILAVVGVPLCIALLLFIALSVLGFEVNFWILLLLVVVAIITIFILDVIIDIQAKDAEYSTESKIKKLCVKQVKEERCVLSESEYDCQKEEYLMEYYNKHFLLRLKQLLTDGRKGYIKKYKDKVTYRFYIGEYARNCLYKMGMASMSEFVYANQFYFSKGIRLYTINADSTVDKNNYSENPYDLFLLPEEKALNFQLHGDVFRKYVEWFDEAFSSEKNITRIELENGEILFDTGKKGTMKLNSITLEL